MDMLMEIHTNSFQVLTMMDTSVDQKKDTMTTHISTTGILIPIVGELIPFVLKNAQSTQLKVFNAIPHLKLLIVMKMPSNTIPMDS